MHLSCNIQSGNYIALKGRPERTDLCQMNSTSCILLNRSTMGNWPISIGPTLLCFRFRSDWTNRKPDRIIGTSPALPTWICLKSRSVVVPVHIDTIKSKVASCIHRRIIRHSTRENSLLITRKCANFFHFCEFGSIWSACVSALVDFIVCIDLLSWIHQR